MKIQEGLIVVSVENLPRNISKDMLQQFNSALQNPKFKEEAKLQGITIEVGILCSDVGRLVIARFAVIGCDLICLTSFW